MGGRRRRRMDEMWCMVGGLGSLHGGLHGLQNFHCHLGVHLVEVRGRRVHLVLGLRDNKQQAAREPFRGEGDGGRESTGERHLRQVLPHELRVNVGDRDGLDGGNVTDGALLDESVATRQEVVRGLRRGGRSRRESKRT